MLMEIFRTVPVHYRREGVDAPPIHPIVRYPPGNYPPYVETIAGIMGLTVAYDPALTKYAQPNSPGSIYMWTSMHQIYWPSWGFGNWRFNATDGKLIERIVVQAGGMFLGQMGSMVRTRKGAFYMGDIWSFGFQQFALGATAEALPGEAPETPQGLYTMGGEIKGSDFWGPYNANGDRMIGVHTGVWAIDEIADTYFDFGLYGNLLFSWNTGKFKYDIPLPSGVAAIALEDESRMYILMTNGVLILYDYVRGEVLGAVKMPKAHRGSPYGTYGVAMTWDSIYRRLLIAEQVPDNPDGSCATVVRGFRQVPMATRLTMPIPLKVPRKGRTIPVLTQVVGDMNEGVGGYVVNAQVLGAGQLVGLPITNHWGETTIQVKCESNALYGYDSPLAASEVDPSGETLPEGVVTVRASAHIYSPDPADIPLSGVPGAPGGGTIGGPTPGPPGGGGGGTFGPNEMPNMEYILERVFKSKTWRLEEIYQYEPDGRGQFTHEAVQAMHDIDARFGHFNKKPPHNRYLGHATDAVCFKNDDGLSQEGADIVSGGSGKYMWGEFDRKARTPDGEYNCWVYPANEAYGTGR